MSSQGPGGAASGRGGRTGAGPAAPGAPSAGACHSPVHGAAGRQQGVPGAQPTPSPLPALPGFVPGAAGVPCAGLAALSVQPPIVGESGAAPGSGDASRCGASAAGPSQPPTPGADGAAVLPEGSPPELLDDDGVPLSAEAAASPFTPPVTERHAAFLRLVDHKTKAALHMRHLRNADFADLAAKAGAPLFGEESIIVANLRAHGARGLTNQAVEELKRGPAGAADAAVLQRRGWVVLLAQALPVLQRRMDNGTLLPGTLRKVEEAYFMHEQQTAYGVMEQPVPPTLALLPVARAFGYETASLAAVCALVLLPLHPWRSDQKERAQAFVLLVLRLIPQTAALRVRMPSENELVNWIERFMTPSKYGADFCASVLAVWRSQAVVDVLRARGALQGGVADKVASDAKFEARQAADLAKRGLRACALPSCGKQEATVLQFRVCGHCQTTRYCCPAHAKAHWPAHKRETEEGEETEGGQGGEAGSGDGAAV